jgi:hypothetical protein
VDPDAAVRVQLRHKAAAQSTYSQMLTTTNKHHHASERVGSVRCNRCFAIFCSCSLLCLSSGSVAVWMRHPDIRATVPGYQWVTYASLACFCRDCVQLVYVICLCEVKWLLNDQLTTPIIQQASARTNLLSVMQAASNIDEFIKEQPPFVHQAHANPETSLVLPGHLKPSAVHKHTWAIRRHQDAIVNKQST